MKPGRLIGPTLAGLSLLRLGLGAQQTRPEVRGASRPYAPHVETIRAQRNVVEVAVVVRDDQGRAIAGLRQNDFELKDDGRVQAISNFVVEGPAATIRPAAPGAISEGPAGEVAAPPAAGSPPLYVGLFFDDGSMSSADLAMARRSAGEFLEKSWNSAMVGALFTSSGTRELRFTSDRAALRAAVASLGPEPRMTTEGISPVHMGPYLAYEISLDRSILSPDVQLAMQKASGAQMCLSRDSCQTIALATADETLEAAVAASADALSAISRAIAELGQMPGRRTLLLTSSGFLTETLQGRQQEIEEQALGAGVVIDALDAKLLATEPVRTSALASSLDFAQRVDLDHVLASLAAATGGEFFHDNNDMASALGDMTSDTGARYLLSFSPTAMAEDGKFHSLRVKLAPGVKGMVQARQGYLDPPPATDAFAAVPSAALDQQMLSSSTSSEVAAQVRTSVTGHDLHIEVAADAGRLHFVRRNGRDTESLLVVSAAFDRSGHFIAGKEGTLDLALTGKTRAKFAKEGVRAQLSLHLPSGHYRLREYIRESNQGHLTTLNREVDIP